MYKQHFPMLNSIWLKIGLGPLFYSGIQKIQLIEMISLLVQPPQILAICIKARIGIHSACSEYYFIDTQIDKWQYCFPYNLYGVAQKECNDFDPLFHWHSWLNTIDICCIG